MPPENQLTSDSELEYLISKQNVPNKRRNSTGPKYFCTIEGCSLSFRRLVHLDRHEYYHTGVKKHVCPNAGCGKAYIILTHLKRHFRTTHEQAPPPQKTVACRLENCNKMFPSEYNMQRHMREVHENPKVYRCSYCSEKFTQKLKMLRHEIKEHSGIYPYTCEKCDRGFFQKRNQERHTINCKVYPCSICELQFDKWSLYLKHCKENNHGSRHKCEHCQRAYAKPTDLKYHIAAKHIVDIKMSFKCKHEGCDRIYAYERNLKQHVKVAHCGKRFECTKPDCDRVFSSGQNLGKHLKRDHENCTKNHPTKIKKDKRKKRKDAGRPKISNIAKLVGVAVDREFDKQLRMRQEEALNVVVDILAEEPSELLEASDNDGIAPTSQAKEENQLEPEKIEASGCALR